MCMIFVEARRKVCSMIEAENCIENFSRRYGRVCKYGWLLLLQGFQSILGSHTHMYRTLRRLVMGLIFHRFCVNLSLMSMVYLFQNFFQNLPYMPLPLILFSNFFYPPCLHPEQIFIFPGNIRYYRGRRQRGHRGPVPPPPPTRAEGPKKFLFIRICFAYIFFCAKISPFWESASPMPDPPPPSYVFADCPSSSSPSIRYCPLTYWQLKIFKPSQRNRQRAPHGS